MATRPELLALGCCEQDLEELRRAAGSSGVALRKVKSDAELATESLKGAAVAVVVGLSEESLSDLEILPVIHSVKHALPVIVIGQGDSLELERRARQKNIFCYLVHPIDSAEARALVQDVMRRAGGG